MGSFKGSLQLCCGIDVSSGQWPLSSKGEVDAPRQTNDPDWGFVVGGQGLCFYEGLNVWDMKHQAMIRQVQGGRVRG